MNFVIDSRDIRKNILALNRLANSSDGADRQYHDDRIKQGHCFVWAEESGRLIFAPSRFAGYRDNRPAEHERNEDRHGGRTNRVISQILRGESVKDGDLETAFQKYCADYRIVPQNRTRLYWRRGV